MAWLKVEQSLPNHRKTLKISDELGIPIPNIIGHLVMFWLWGMDSAKDGRLDNITPGMIARVSGWTGDPDAFVSALVSAGFFERDDDGMRIRNWERYAGRLIEKREEDAKRKRRYREKERVSGQRADGDESEIVTSVGRPQDIRSPSDVERKKERKKEIKISLAHHAMSICQMIYLSSTSSSSRSQSSGHTTREKSPRLMLERHSQQSSKKRQ